MAPRSGRNDGLARPGSPEAALPGPATGRSRRMRSLSSPRHGVVLSVGGLDLGPGPSLWVSPRSGLPGQHMAAHPRGRGNADGAPGARARSRGKEDGHCLGRREGAGGALWAVDCRNRAEEPLSGTSDGGQAEGASTSRPLVARTTTSTAWDDFFVNPSSSPGDRWSDFPGEHAPGCCPFYSGSLKGWVTHRGERSQETHLATGWGDLPDELLDRVLHFFQGADPHPVPPFLEPRVWTAASMLQAAHLVNRHWCLWANESSLSESPSLKVPDPLTTRSLESHIARRFVNLHGLVLDRRETIDDRTFLALNSLPLLRHLDASHCTRVTDEALGRLTRLTNLSDLVLEGCGRVTDEGVAHLRSLSLSHLSLGRCARITDRSLRSLAGMTCLVQLDLAGCARISDSGLNAVAPLTQLAHLSLSRCRRIGDDGLRHLKVLKNLTHLDLSGCVRITARGVSCLSSLKKLSRVDFRQCWGLSNAAMALLAQDTNRRGRGLEIWGYK
eukprot:evm.model.scf_319EXC.4 EVM.evm.TU.scf_319EXC.4   scf_319EXC:17839-23368(+)